MICWDSPEAQQIIRNAARKVTQSARLRPWREDVEQEIRLALWRHGPADGALAQTIARRRAIDWVRRETMTGKSTSRRPRPAPASLDAPMYDDRDDKVGPWEVAPDDPAAEAVGRVQAAQIVDLCRRTLTDVQREAFAAALTPGERAVVAERRGVTQSSVYYSYRGAQKKLQQALHLQEV